MKVVLYISKQLAHRYKQHQIFQSGGSLAFFFMLSFFPLLIFINALLGYFDLQITDFIVSIAPMIPEVAITILNTYVNSIANSSGGLLSFSFIGALLSASVAVNALITAIHRAYNQPNHRSFLKTRALAITLTFIIGIALSSSLILPMFGRNFFLLIAQYIQVPMIYIELWSQTRLITSIIIVASTLYLMYRIIPFTPYRQSVLPGTILALIGWSVSSWIFALYVNNFWNYSAFYGSLGAVIVLMMWMLITGIFIILGAEFNDIIDQISLKKRYVKITDDNPSDY